MSLGNLRIMYVISAAILDAILDLYYWCDDNLNFYASIVFIDTKSTWVDM